MQIGIVIEGQMGLSYERQRDLARRAESLGFAAFYRTDHYESFPGPDDQPTTDAWSVLAGIARETERAPKLLLVGQPTRGVDIGAIEFIHRRLVELGPEGRRANEPSAGLLRLRPGACTSSVGTLARCIRNPRGSRMNQSTR